MIALVINIIFFVFLGTKLVLLNASDLDSDPTAAIGFVVGNGGKDNFAVDFNTGWFQLASQANLSIKTFGNNYSVIVCSINCYFQLKL